MVSPPASRTRIWQGIASGERARNSSDTESRTLAVSASSVPVIETVETASIELKNTT